MTLTASPQEIYENALNLVASSRLSLGEPFGEMTTADEVRAIFGLSDAEIPDDMLTQSVYATEIHQSLSKVIQPKLNSWADVVQSQEVNDVKLVKLVKLWVAYAYADKICDVLPLVVAKTLTDNKASYSRFEYDVATLVANVRKRFALAEEAIKDLLLDETTNIPLPALFGSGKPTFDPVTNSGAS